MPFTSAKLERLRSRFERRLTKSTEPNGCWTWSYCCDDKGYGVCSWIGEHFAHRVSYRIYIGPIPKGLFVLHKCDNPICVNPEHFFLGTQKQNCEDCVAKGRNSRGEVNGMTKLTTAQVEEIRSKYFSQQRYTKGGYTQKNLAAEYGVYQGTISAIVKGKAWKHLLETSNG